MDSTTTTPKERRFNNLEITVTQFSEWQEMVLQLIDERTLLSQRISELESEKENLQQHRDQLKEDIVQFQKQVDQFREIVAKRCDYEDDNRKLKENIENMSLDLIEKDSLHKIEIEKFKDDMKALIATHEEEMRKFSENCEQRALTEKTRYEALASEKEAKNDACFEEYESKLKEKDNEIARLRLDFDTKLHQVQKQVNKAQQPMPNTAAQDIFRKKLQHTKNGYEIELNKAKATISELQEKIQQLEAEKTNNQRNPAIGTRGGQKRRRLLSNSANFYNTNDFS
ncbi:uncharacterized protein LOC141909064 [Tubulanus polymorphus]|uniref:uncharacterized protein LOC141909064 n=1 Tax=Tubulanus polymorphus TaxID=672921 RepID=UPI003DA286BF